MFSLQFQSCCFGPVSYEQIQKSEVYNSVQSDTSKRAGSMATSVQLSGACSHTVRLFKAPQFIPVTAVLSLHFRTIHEILVRCIAFYLRTFWQGKGTAIPVQAHRGPRGRGSENF